MLAANRTEVRNMESGLQEVGRAVAAAGRRRMVSV